MNPRGWKEFSRQALADLKLWAFLLAYLSLMRGAFIFLYRSHMAPESGAQEIITALLNGARYDSVAAAYFIYIGFLFTISTAFLPIGHVASSARKAIGILFITLSTLLYAITVEYFREFNDQINFFAFNILYDDQEAVAITAWKEYNLARNLLLWAVASWGTSKLMLRWLRPWNGNPLRERITEARGTGRAALAAALLITLALIGRGSLGDRPVQIQDAAATTDQFINKAVLNPYFAIKYAFQGYRKANAGEHVTSDQVRAALDLYFKGSPRYDNIDDYIKKTARGINKNPPKHIYLIIMESYDSWAMLDKYNDLHLTDNLERIGSEGIYIKRFLPATSSSMMSYSTILLSMQDFWTNYKPEGEKPFPSSAATIFKRMGYKTRFFRGGYPSWQRVGDFMKAQGFDELYGAAEMSEWTKTNEWGVDDEELFDFVLKHQDSEEPTFNLIITTTYHPPYDIDLEAKGFPLKEMPENIKPLNTNPKIDLNIIGHLWYSDNSLAKFIREAEARDKGMLFAVTGDHFGRKHISAIVEPYEQASVPFVLYGKKALAGLSVPPGTAASHVDIVPTLVELAAPAGFEYYGMGQDIFLESRRPFGMSKTMAIGADFLAHLSHDPVMLPLPFDDARGAAVDPDEIKALNNAYNAIGWWRTFKGPLIKDK